jgi:hypothetical protein
MAELGYQGELPLRLLHSIARIESFRVTSFYSQKSVVPAQTLMAAAQLQSELLARHRDGAT